MFIKSNHSAGFVDDQSKNRRTEKPTHDDMHDVQAVARNETQSDVANGNA